MIDWTEPQVDALVHLHSLKGVWKVIAADARNNDATYYDFALVSNTATTVSNETWDPSGGDRMLTKKEIILLKLKT